KGIEKTR
ncbi:histidine kinase-, DNA gyrase B-, and HSP90-like ATPase family protein, partial [Chlamydia psittaci 03DC29]